MLISSRRGLVLTFKPAVKTAWREDLTTHAVPCDRLRRVHRGSGLQLDVFGRAARESGVEGRGQSLRNAAADGDAHLSAPRLYPTHREAGRVRRIQPKRILRCEGTWRGGGGDCLCSYKANAENMARMDMECQRRSLPCSSIAVERNCSDRGEVRARGVEVPRRAGTILYKSEVAVPICIKFWYNIWRSPQRSWI